MRVGVIGCGLMGQRRAAHLEPDDILVGGYDPVYPSSWTESRVELDRLIGESDVLVVATPHDALARLALHCVREGKHVLLEKPCARTAAELSPVLAAIAGTATVVVPGFTLRHYPGIQMARSYLADREPCYLRALYGHPGRPGYEKEWRCDPARGGGELLDQGTHLIDLTRFLLGPTTLQDYVGQRDIWGTVEDMTFLRLSAARGTALLQASWIEWQPTFRLEIVCRDNSAEVSGLGGGYGYHGFRAHTRGARTGGYVRFWGDARDEALRAEWRAFKVAVQEGRSQLQDAMDVLNIVDKARSR